MGLFLSQYSKIKPEFNSEWLTECNNLSLSKDDVSKLRKLFRRACNGKHSTDLPTLLKSFKVANSSLLTKMLETEVSNAHVVDFRHFVLSIYNICSLSFEMMARFVFKLYDTKQEGYIDFQSVVQILEDNYDKTLSSRLIVDKVTIELMSIRSKHQTIDLHSFIKLSQSHYKLLLPIYTVQTQLRRVVLGLKFWNQAMQRRTAVCCGTYLAMHSYLHVLHKVAQADEDAHTRAKLCSEHSSSVTHRSDPENSISYRSAASGPTGAEKNNNSSSNHQRTSAHSRKLGGGVVLDLTVAPLRNKRLLQRPQS